MHEGHRQRMLARLEQADYLEEHELLEMLLFNAIPRRNTNDLAHALIETFGSLDGVLSAKIDDLAEIEGVGRSTAAYLRLVGLFHRRKNGELPVAVRALNAHDFSEFVLSRIGDLEDEVIEVYCIDIEGNVCACKRYPQGTTDTACVPAGEISELLAFERPNALVVAHNHPASGCSPSHADDVFTAKLALLCGINGVVLQDHLIVSAEGVYSYHVSGRMQNIRTDYDVAEIIREKGVK